MALAVGILLCLGMVMSAQVEPPLGEDVRPPADVIERLERFGGEWRRSTPDAEELVEEEVRRVTDMMSFLIRRIAPGRLMDRTRPPATIHLEPQDELFIMTLDNDSPQTLPISGEPIQEDDVTVRLELDEMPQGTLRHVTSNQQGRRDNVFRLDANGDDMTMKVTIASPRLPDSVQYTLEFTRQSGSDLSPR